MPERAPDRLVRLLGIVAFLNRHEYVPVAELATTFGVTARQILEDIDTLWVSGTPGYQHSDLIDFDAEAHDRGVVRLTESRGLTRPLRLGTREGVALIAALRALRDLLGSDLPAEQSEVVESTLEALTAAVGDAAAAVDVDLAADGRPDVRAAVQSALVSAHRLRIQYVNAADVTSERDIDPVRLVTGDTHTYLQAWCLRARGERLFRLDRVLSAEVLNKPAEPHPIPAEPGSEVFRPEADAEQVHLTLSSRARWVAEQVPVDAVKELPNGDFRVTLRVADGTWLRHLIAQVAADVRAVEPARYALEVAETAERALAAYGALPPG
jgi:proteasome accessory factor C